MSRDSENELRIIDDKDVKTSTEKPVSKRLLDDLESEFKTEMKEMKEDIGQVSERIFNQKNHREI